MDILDFVSKTEWPLLVGGTLWYLRAPLSHLIKSVSLTKIDAWGVKAEFEKGLTTVEALNPAENSYNERSPSAKVAPAQIDMQGPNALMYVGSPSMIVLDSWRRLELTLRKMTNQYSGGFKLETISKRFGFDEDEKTSYSTLRDLRNTVAHSNDLPITWDDAERFQLQTYQLINRILEGKPDG